MVEITVIANGELKSARGFSVYLALVTAFGKLLNSLRVDFVPRAL